jgi:hypothetical protein
VDGDDLARIRRHPAVLDAALGPDGELLVVREANCALADAELRAELARESGRPERDVQLVLDLP